MRTFDCLVLALLALICAVAAQQPPALGDHEFPTVSVANLSSINFPPEARVVERNYTVFNPVPSVVRAIGYRIAAASNGDTAAGVAVNVITGALTTLGEPSISLAYFSAKAGIAINPTDSNAALGFTAAAIAFTARFMAIAEFEDLNGNGEMDYATELIGGYDLGAAQFAPIEFGLDKTGAAPYYYAQTETLDGVFALRVIGCGRLAAITEGTTTLNTNPTTLKVSLSIRYFNNSLNVPRVGLTRGPSSNPKAQLALVAGFGVIAAKAAAGLAVKNFTAAQKDYNGNSLNNLAVSTNAAAFTGGFSWVNSAEARDVAGNIIAGGAVVKSAVVDSLGNSSYSNKVSAGVFASFKYAKLGVYSFGAIRPVSLVWDPSASTVDDTSSASAAVIPALAAVILAVLMLAL